MALGIHYLQAFFCLDIFKHLNLFQWAALVEEGEKVIFRNGLLQGWSRGHSYVLDFSAFSA